MSEIRLGLKIEEIDDHSLKLITAASAPIGGLSAVGGALLEVEIDAPSLSEKSFELIASYLKQSPVVSKLSIFFCNIENEKVYYTLLKLFKPTVVLLSYSLYT